MVTPELKAALDKGVADLNDALTMAVPGMTMSDAAHLVNTGKALASLMASIPVDTPAPSGEASPNTSPQA